MTNRMFEGLTTWNPVFGCNHHCYNDGCWAKRKFAHRQGVQHKWKGHSHYRPFCQQHWDFTPHWVMGKCRKAEVPREPRIFVVAHGDLFGSWVPEIWIEKVLAIARSIPKEMWFFETKNPARYYEFLKQFPENAVLSSTIETNRNDAFSKAPSTKERYLAMRDLNFPKHVSIEPIIDFDLEILVDWIKQIAPTKVAVGYDSLHNNLPEPTIQKAELLVDQLEEFAEIEKKHPWR